MAKIKDPKMRFRVLLGISVWIVVIGVVGLVTTVPRLFEQHHLTTVQAFIFRQSRSLSDSRSTCGPGGESEPARAPRRRYFRPPVYPRTSTVHLARPS